MKYIYDADIAYAALKKELGRKPECPRTHFDACLALLQKKHKLKNQIRELEKQIAAEQREVELSHMYVMHGTEYTRLLSVIYEWGEENGLDAL